MAVAAIAFVGIVIGLSHSSALNVTKRRSEIVITRAVAAGDVVFFRTTTWRGRLVRALEGDSEEYTHVGIVIDADTKAPRIAHACPIKPAIVRIERLPDILANDEVTSAVIYRPRVPEAQARKAALIAERYAARKVPFDFEFDLADDSAVYCTELIWLSYRGAGLKIEVSHNIIFPADLVRAGFFVPLTRDDIQAGELR